MKNPMQFSVNKKNNKINVEKVFSSPIDSVWAAWTQKELLDQWWAPKPWKAETKSIEFREGGRWLYAMVGPEGEKHWSFANYFIINPKESYSAKDGFCDEDGNLKEDWPRSTWHNRFEDNGETTVVKIEITFPSLTDLEKTIEMGFQEGFTMGLDNLDSLLASS